MSELPSRPLLAPWRDYTASPDKFMLRYAEGMVVFEGRASTALVPDLVQLLDGGHTVEQIVETLGPAIRPATEQALNMLNDHGLLLEGASQDETDPALTTARSLAEVSVGGVQLDEIAQTVRDAKFTVVGDGALAAELVRVLRGAGASNTQAMAECDLNTQMGELEGRRVVVAPISRYARVLLDVNSWAMREGQRWTQVLPYDGKSAVIGPTYVPRQTGCYYCFRLRARSAVDYFDEAVEFDAAADAVPVQRTAAWHSLAQDAAVAGHAGHLLLWSLLPEDSTVYPLLGRCFTVTWNMVGVQTSTHALHRVPRCRECGRSGSTGIPQPWVPPEAALEVANSTGR